MEGIGNAEVHDIDGGIVEERAVIVVDLGDAEAACQLLRPASGLAGHGDNLDGDALHLLVGAQVKRRRESGSHHSHFH